LLLAEASTAWSQLEPSSFGLETIDQAVTSSCALAFAGTPETGASDTAKHSTADARDLTLIPSPPRLEERGESRRLTLRPRYKILKPDL
jgi:hypothetical protein